MNQFVITFSLLLTLGTFSHGNCQTVITPSNTTETPLTNPSLKRNPNSEYTNPGATSGITSGTTPSASPQTSPDPLSSTGSSAPSNTENTESAPQHKTTPTDSMMHPPSATPPPCSAAFRFDGHKLRLTNKEWKSRLTREQFQVLRLGKSEPPFATNEYKSTRVGLYRCAGCLLALFSTSSKFDANNGIPSFNAPICIDNVDTNMNWNLFSSTKDVECSRCEGHLGQVFNDGPPPTGKRYSVQPSAIIFTEE